MAEKAASDSFPVLKELESKTGLKTPESLLIWMKDAAHWEDCWISDGLETRESKEMLKGSFSDKIRDLQQEMNWLRTADVRILRQLMVVHEGIEALRWLAEERGTPVTCCSSLTGSQSSLATVDGLGSSMSPGRESPNPTCLPYSNDAPVGAASEDPALDDNSVSNSEGYNDMLGCESTEARSSSPSGFRSEVSCSTGGRPGQAWSSISLTTANRSDGASALNRMLQPQFSNTASMQDLKTSAESIRRALLRSGRTGGMGLKRDDDGFAPTKEGGDTQMHRDLTGKSLSDCDNDVMEEQNTPGREEVLLGYDAQWCWVESQDDVTFL